MTRITVAMARATSQQFASSPANFVTELNLVCEKLMAGEMWNDTLGIVEFRNGTGTGLITLPPQYASVVGWELFGNAEPVFDTWREWQEGGFGHIDTSKFRTDAFYEVSGGAVAQNDIPNGVPGYIQLFPNNPADAGKTCRFFGLDQNNEPIYDSTGAMGVALTSAFPSSQTTQLFNSLTGVQLPGFIGASNLYANQGGAKSFLSFYPPKTVIPYFKRYRVGPWVPNPAQPNCVPIRAFCRLQHMDVSDETDYVNPGNRNALEIGLQALKERRANNTAVEDQKWARAYQELDNDLAQYRGAAQITLRLEGMALPRNEQWGLGWCGYGQYGFSN